MSKSNKSPLTIVFVLAVIIVIIVVWFTSCKEVKSKESPSTVTPVVASTPINGTGSENVDTNTGGEINPDVVGSGSSSVSGDVNPDTSISGAFDHYLWEKAE